MTFKPMQGHAVPTRGCMTAHDCACQLHGKVFCQMMRFYVTRAVTLFLEASLYVQHVRWQEYEVHIIIA